MGGREVCTSVARHLGRKYSHHAVRPAPLALLAPPRQQRRLSDDVARSEARTAVVSAYAGGRFALRHRLFRRHLPRGKAPGCGCEAAEGGGRRAEGGAGAGLPMRRRRGDAQRGQGLIRAAQDCPGLPRAAKD